MDEFFSLPKSKVFTSEIEINKSRFLGFCKYATDVEEAKRFVTDLKRQYNDARHVVYAYVVDGFLKSSDDGEPSGTAGRPMLEILKHLNCNHIVCVVVRYFGGIKLGTGGLLRAYQSTTQQALQNNLKQFSRGRLFVGDFDYPEFKGVEHSLKSRKIKILKTEYQQKIKLELVCFDDQDIKKMNYIGDTYEILEENNANN